MPRLEARGPRPPKRPGRGTSSSCVVPPPRAYPRGDAPSRAGSLSTPRSRARTGAPRGRSRHGREDRRIARALERARRPAGRRQHPMRPRPGPAIPRRRCRRRIWSPCCSPTTCGPTSRRPRCGGRSRFVLSKGHAAPLLYAVLKAIGAIDDDDAAVLRGWIPDPGTPCPVPELPWVEAAGIAGQGPAIGLGMALGMRLWESPARVWVLVGDSEAAEGSSGRRWRPRRTTASQPRLRARPEPARPARPDDARLGCGRLRRARRRTGGTRSRSTATTAIDAAYRSAAEAVDRR